MTLLRVFHAIAEENSLTLAGNRLGLSQPAVSYALGRLRAMFNDPLFLRSGNTMQPTSTALELREPIRRAMSSIQQALSYGQRFDPASSARTFQITMSDIGEMVFLPPLCEKLRELAPNVHLEVSQLPLSQIEEALRSGRLDLAIGNLPTLKTSTHFQTLFQEAYVCMTRKHAGETRRKLSVSEYLELAHVFVAAADNSHRMVEDFLRARNMRRMIALQIPHFSVVPQILQRTDWAVTLPRRAAQNFNSSRHFSIFELPEAIPEVEVTVHWHADFEDSEANAWFRKLVIETLAE